MVIFVVPPDRHIWLVS